MTKSRNILILSFLAFFLINKTLNAGNIEINEIHPNPKGKDVKHEWLELKNSGKYDIDLTNWKIANDKKAAKLKGFIKAGSFLILEGKSLKVSLKNKGDEIKLINDYGKITDKVKYQDVPEGLSYSKNTIKSDEKTKILWQWTTATKNKPNLTLYVLNGEIIEDFYDETLKIKTPKNNILNIYRKSNSNDLLIKKLLSKTKKIQITVEKSQNKLILKNIEIL